MDWSVDKRDLYNLKNLNIDDAHVWEHSEDLFKKIKKSAYNFNYRYGFKLSVILFEDQDDTYIIVKHKVQV